MATPYFSLLLILGLFKAVNTLECTYDDGPSQFTYTESVTCSCRGNADHRVDPGLSNRIFKLEISSCTYLKIEFHVLRQDEILLKLNDNEEDEKTEEVLQLSGIVRDTQINITDIESLLLLMSNKARLDVTFTNVALIESQFLQGDNDEIPWIGISHEQLYFYLVIALTSTLVIVIITIPFMIFCAKKGSSSESCCQKQRGGDNDNSKRVSRAESWRFESSHYVNPTSRTRARMTTHQLPYQLVPQRQTADHIASYLGRSTQVPLHIGLPTTAMPEDDDPHNTSMIENSFDNVSNISSTPSYDPSQNTSTLPATQRTTID